MYTQLPSPTYVIDEFVVRSRSQSDGTVSLAVSQNAVRISFGAHRVSVYQAPVLNQSVDSVTQPFYARFAVGNKKKKSFVTADTQIDRIGIDVPANVLTALGAETISNHRPAAAAETTL